MSVEQFTIQGVVKDGVIIPDVGAQLPEGTRVSIRVDATDLPVTLKAEFAAWERASDEAWALIEEWEKETPA